MEMKLTKEFVNSCRKVGVLRDFLCQAIDQVDEKDKEIAELEEERRWRKFPDEKPTEEMEGMDFIVSNGFFHREISEWRGYWNNDPFCGDRHCDEVKYWMPLPSAPKEEK